MTVVVMVEWGVVVRAITLAATALDIMAVDAEAIDDNRCK